jgi:hypothetical protein
VGRALLAVLVGAEAPELTLAAEYLVDRRVRLREDEYPAADASTGGRAQPLLVVDHPFWTAPKACQALR